MTGRPIHRYPVEERRAMVERFVGLRVTAFLDPHRDGSRFRSYAGELVAVAYPTSGTVSDQAVIVLDPGFTCGGRRAASISLATLAGLIALGAGEIGFIPAAEVVS